MTGQSHRWMFPLAVSGFVMLVVVAWETYQFGGGTAGTPSKQQAITRPTSQVSRGNPVDDDFSQVMAIFDHGGTVAEIERAIETLDTLTRRGEEVSTDQHAALLSAMGRGNPSELSEGSWSHLFNSACNVLAVGRSTPDEESIKLLKRIALEDPRLVMRLYALQHLGVRYDTATPDCQNRLRDLVRHILSDPESQTAGTALVLWERWEHSTGPDSVSSMDLSRGMVMDTSRPVDVRVSALHSIGDDPGVLDLARTIALDLTQPVILRKAALSLIGRHGQSSDLALLQRCSQENPRLAQAGNPAAVDLKLRLNSSKQPVLIQIQ
jgi:hypothetical protein